MSEAPLKDCPDCHKPSLQKLVSAAGFQLKGTGWYATDFKNKTQPGSTSEKKSDTDTKTNANDKKGDASSTTDTTV
jgi:predicted nucleic acid-binding Zn ribbon protein